MSASSPNLKHPVLIIGLVLGAVAVTILNIQTFGPGQRPSRRVQAAAQNQPALPPDLALLVQNAMSAEDQSGLKAPAASDLPRLPRDPFQAQAVTPKVSKTAERPKASSPRPAELICSAVMTGGQRPSAMINGKFYSPGDKVAGYTLAWVATSGVTLNSSKGVKKFVPLTNKSRQSGALVVKLGNKPSTTEQ